MSVLWNVKGKFIQLRYRFLVWQRVSLQNERAAALAVLQSAQRNEICGKGRKHAMRVEEYIPRNLLIGIG